jgi:hypothetical protein
MIAPGHFPILDQCVRGRWKRIYGSLTFEGVGEPMPVPPGYVRVDSGGFGPQLLPKAEYLRALDVQEPGWAYQ